MEIATPPAATDMMPVSTPAMRWFMVIGDALVMQY
jgi:hypothetical protein